MKIVLPNNLEKQIAKELSDGLSRGSRYTFDIHALHVLRELTPDMARNSEIHDLVRQYLTCGALGYRWYAALILDAIGDDLGVLHLTYNCLRKHPIIGQDQTRVSGWGDSYLFDCMQKAPDECIDLLIEDVREPPGYLHADILSALPAERIVPRMLPLLSEPLRVSAQAAYVLAMRGCDEGRHILEQIAESVNLRFLELALIGLSHIPDERALDLIRGYATPEYPEYAQERKAFSSQSWASVELLTKAQQRLFLLEHKEEGAIFNPATQSWEQGELNQPIAGEYHAIALDLQGVGASQIVALKSRLEATKAKLEQFQANPNDTIAIQNLTKEDLSGDMLYSGILGYFANVDASDQLNARTGKQVVNYRMPSYGAFFAVAQPRYWFGIVRNVSFPGVVMDVDRLFYQVEAKDTDQQKRVAYLRQVGAAGSAFEHAVPERIFADPSKPLTDPSQPQGVSAVKALAIAAAQGQRIYTITGQNVSGVLPQLAIGEEAKSEIANAVATGKSATVH